MQKSKLHSQTYTLDTQSSQSQQNSARNHKASPRLSTAQTPQSKACQSSCPDQAGKDVIEQDSELNTSGANNNTIYECLQLLTHNELSFGQEDSSLHSLLSDKEKHQLRRRMTSSKLRDDNKAAADSIRPEERFRARSIGVVNLTSNSKLATSGGKIDKNATGNVKVDVTKNRKDVPSTKSCDKERKSAKLEGTGRSKAGEQKSCLKDQRASTSGNCDGESPRIHGTATGRGMDKEKLSHCKGYETVNLTSRLATSPLTERESHAINKAVFFKSATRGVSPNSTKDKMNKSKTESSNPFIKDRYQTVLSKKSSDTITPAATSLNQSAQPKRKPLTVSLSKNPHNTITPRNEALLQKNENQKPVDLKKEAGRKSVKKDSTKSDSKLKKEFKPLKQNKVDLVEVNLHRKTTRKLKEEKMEECFEKIEEMYEKLKKCIIEKKETLSQNDNFLQALENLRNSMNDTQSLLKC